MASKDCYHFTKLSRAYGIDKKGLVPRLENNSKAVQDGDAKISFSDGRVAAIGLFSDVYRVYKEKKHNSEIDDSIEEILGEGIYLTFDGTEIENTGGNKGHINPVDAATRTPILPENLKVCVLKDDEGNIHYSQYDYFDFLVANMTKEDEQELAKMDNEKGDMCRTLKEYREENKEGIQRFSDGGYEPELITLDDFCKKYKLEINASINEYLQQHYKDTQKEISQLNKEFSNMPVELQDTLKECQTKYKDMMEKMINGDLSEIDMPIAEFYEMYKEEFDKIITPYCESVIESSKTEISELREEVDGMEEYKDLFLHSSHHIKNVVEFAYIIGKTEDTLGEDFDLLIQSAKYHDSGREKSEWLSDNHSDPSAIHAEEELLKTGRYTPEQIAMIKVAIRYHEHSERNKNEFDEEYFTKIAETDGVPKEKFEKTRLMCQYLKDADALDRVRLGNLDPSYLRTSVAKSDVFLREHGKKKDSIDWENAGLAVQRNKDFDLEQELYNALQKLKRDYSENEEVLSQIETIEKTKKGIGSVIKNVRKVLEKNESREEKSITEEQFSKDKVCDIAKQEDVAMEDENANEVMQEIYKSHERQNSNLQENWRK